MNEVLDALKKSLEKNGCSKETIKNILVEMEQKFNDEKGALEKERFETLCNESGDECVKKGETYFEFRTKEDIVKFVNLLRTPGSKTESLFGQYDPFDQSYCPDFRLTEKEGSDYQNPEFIVPADEDNEYCDATYERDYSSHTKLFYLVGEGRYTYNGKWTPDIAILRRECQKLGFNFILHSRYPGSDEWDN